MLVPPVLEYITDPNLAHEISLALKFESRMDFTSLNADALMQ